MPIVSPWKKDFPVFSAKAHPNLCYLDSAATCLTPKYVADGMYQYLCYSHANSHKGLYQLSADVTERVEHARHRVANFIGALDHNTIVFTSGTTESLNLLAYSYLEPIITEASNIIISAAEHHANLLPWQRLCQQYGASLRIAPLDDTGLIDVEKLKALVDVNTQLIAINHSSNVIGKSNPIQEICQFARHKGVITVIDGAQAVIHGNTNVETLGCDFYVFSGHKLYGPTGCGVLYGRAELLEQMRPYQVGGGIIEHVDYNSSRFLAGPLKFEPGSHNVASIVGLVEALNYLESISWKAVNHYLDELSQYLQKSLAELSIVKPLVPFHGSTTPTSSALTPYLLSFQLDKVHSHDVASLLDSEQIAIRAGHHCAQPLHKTLGVNASVRVSLGLYNDHADIDRLVNALTQTHQLMAVN
ncbi:aminotransferase class V-fold PLP-dependent enzyme [Thalassotalea piscium]